MTTTEPPAVPPQAITAVADLDEEAVVAATEALHRGDSYCCDCVDPDQHDQFWRRDRTDAVRALEAARPHLAAAERERCAHYLRTVHPAWLLTRHGLQPSAGAAHVLAAAASDIYHGKTVADLLPQEDT